MTPAENPFRTARLNKIPFLFPEGDSLENLYNDFKQLSFRGAFAGPKGSGKTTLLEQFIPILKNNGFHVKMIKLSCEKRRLSREYMVDFYSGLTSDTVVLLDGCEQMRLYSWYRFRNRVLAKSAGLLITVHKNRNRMPLLRQHKPSFELLQMIVAYLLNVDGERLPLPDEKTVRSLYTKNRKNIRNVLLDLYDLYT